MPIPTRWHEMFELLLNNQGEGSGEKLSPPLILGAWGHTSNLDKIVRLQSQIMYRWAEDHDVFALVDDFLRQLPENEWHHLRD